MITAICIAASVALTVTLFVLMVGTDPGVTLAGFDVLMILLGISICVPAVIPPVMSYRMTQLLRDLTLAQERLNHLAQTDQLTGLLNRRGFDEQATAMLAAGRVNATPVSAMMTDIDRFKSINDQQGHDFGDAALKHVAAIMLEVASREKVVVGRQGGDEFAMLVHGLAPHEAFALAEDIRSRVAREPFDFEGRSVSITISCGLAPAMQEGGLPGGQLGACMSLADAALLEAKRQGRNRVCVSAGS